MTIPSYKSLLAERQELDEKIDAARRREVTEALSQIHQIMTDFGLTIKDIEKKVKRKPAEKKAELKPKYRDPASGLTWSGRGKPPPWIAGKERSLFKIDSETTGKAIKTQA